MVKRQRKYRLLWLLTWESRLPLLHTWESRLKSLHTWGVEVIMETYMGNQGNNGYIHGESR